MLDWIRNRLREGLAKLSDLVSAAVDVVRGVWRTVSSVFDSLRVGWATLTRGILGFLHGVLDFVAEVPRGLWRITTKIIPAWAAKTFREATTWANRTVGRVRDALSGALAALRRWAEAGVSWVRNRVEDVLRWLWARLAPVIDWVNRFANRAVDIVLHPDKLATWILPALWGPLWRFIESRAEPIGRWLLRRSVAATLRAAGTIESVLARIL